MSDPSVECGDCCRHIGTPPRLYPSDDLPPVLRDELIVYYTAVENEEIPDREELRLPCLWLTADGRCRHYEYRPQMCREEVIPGDEWCTEFRAQYGRLPLPVVA